MVAEESDDAASLDGALLKEEKKPRRRKRRGSDEKVNKLFLPPPPPPISCKSPASWALLVDKQANPIILNTLSFSSRSPTVHIKRLPSAFHSNFKTSRSAPPNPPSILSSLPKPNPSSLLRRPPPAYLQAPASPITRMAPRKRKAAASRKRKSPEEAGSGSGSSPEGPPRGSTKASSRGKRVKAPKEKEPEYFPETRNLEDLWKAAFPVGTEWDNLEKLGEINWNFENLENAFEEGGELHGKKVYLFGCTEPQLLRINDEEKVTCVPVVVAVVSPFPPSDKVGIKSVQREKEEIVPMKTMKMDWVPYIPVENRLNQVERFKAQIFTMACTQRRSALRHLKEDRIKLYEYCLPYFYQPLQEDEDDYDTVVSIIYPMEPPVVQDFDMELDDIEEFADGLITDEVLPEDQRDAFKDFVKERVRERKKAQREAREARRKAREEMDPVKKAAFENMQFYKFYPVKTCDTPDISAVKSRFINRYYGKAHMIL